MPREGRRADGKPPLRWSVLQTALDVEQWRSADTIAALLAEQIAPEDAVREITSLREKAMPLADRIAIGRTRLVRKSLHNAVKDVRAVQRSDGQRKLFRLAAGPAVAAPSTRHENAIRRIPFTPSDTRGGLSVYHVIAAVRAEPGATLSRLLERLAPCFSDDADVEAAARSKYGTGSGNPDLPRTFPVESQLTGMDRPTRLRALLLLHQLNHAQRTGRLTMRYALTVHPCEPGV